MKYLSISFYDFTRISIKFMVSLVYLIDYTTFLIVGYLVTLIEDYRIVASRSTSRLVTCLGLFRLFMKGIFGPYVL